VDKLYAIAISNTITTVGTNEQQISCISHCLHQQSQGGLYTVC